MALIILPLGNEQAFTSANTFAANSTVGGATLVRIVNTGNTSAVVTISNTVVANIYSDISTEGVSWNLTILPYTEVFVQKLSNNTLTASSGNLLGVACAFTH